MADRTLVLYEEPRNPEGPHWTLAIERSAAGQPGGIITIAEKFEPGMPLADREMTVVLDDLRRLQPALDWANGIQRGESRPQVLVGWDNLEALHRLLWTALLPNNGYDIGVRLRGERMLALLGQAIGWPDGPPSTASLIAIP